MIALFFKVKFPSAMFNPVRLVDIPPSAVIFPMPGKVSD
jgi:hypothetical protein